MVCELTEKNEPNVEHPTANQDIAKTKMKPTRVDFSKYNLPLEQLHRYAEAQY